MGIIDMRTSLKSLKYPDRQGPFYQRPELLHGSDDFKIQNILPVHSNPMVAGAEDVIRVSAWLAKSIEGNLFFLKQAGLQRMNGDMNIGLQRHRKYNPALMLMQVANAGLGSHLNRVGTLGEEPRGYLFYQEDAVTRNVEISNIISLYKRLIDSQNPYDNINQPHIISEIEGGPNSLMGIGKTTINRSYYTNIKKEEKNIPQYVDDSQIVKKGEPSIMVDRYKNTRDPRKSYQAKAESTPVTDRYKNSRDPRKAYEERAKSKPVTDRYKNSRDPRKSYEAKTKIFPDRYKKSRDPRKSYEAQDHTKSDIIKGHDVPRGKAFTDKTTVRGIEQQYGLGDPYIQSNKIPYKRNASDGTVGEVLPFYTDDVEKPGGYSKFLSGGNLITPNKDILHRNINDLIPFRFELIDNDLPTYGIHLAFRSTLTSYSDTDSSNWSSIRYNGRGESFYVYDHTVRNITFNFRVAAETREGLKAMWIKLNTLKSALYGDYKKLKMRGSLVRITIGDLLTEQPGFISNLSITIPEESNWEIDSARNYKLPMIADVSVTFTPIHDFLPQKSLAKSPFVIPSYELSGKGRGWLSMLNKLEESINGSAIQAQEEQRKARVATKTASLYNVQEEYTLIT